MKRGFAMSKFLFKKNLVKNSESNIFKIFCKDKNLFISNEYIGKIWLSTSFFKDNKFEIFHNESGAAQLHKSGKKFYIINNKAIGFNYKLSDFLIFDSDKEFKRYYKMQIFK